MQQHCGKMECFPAVIGHQGLLYMLNERLTGNGMRHGDSKVFVGSELGSIDNPKEDSVDLNMHRTSDVLVEK
jgi:hypothetical protein